MKKIAFITLFLLTACDGMRGPSLHSDPSKMSGDTLCYRAAYAKTNQALSDEVAARHLDCDAVLEDQGGALGAGERY